MLRVTPSVSVSWKASLPIRGMGTWPVKTTIGTESMKGVGNAGHGVGGAGAAGHEHGSDLARGLGVALRRMRAALFVAHQYMLEIRLHARHFVIYVNYRPAGMSEDNPRVLRFQRVEKDLRARHLLADVLLHGVSAAKARLRFRERGGGAGARHG